MSRELGTECLIPISIVVPAYNAQRTIIRCLDSLVSQENVNIEVIVVDDGSTDSTSIILDEYSASHERVKVIHVLNGGPAKARNIGLSHSSGEYITFCDADDWLDGGCLSIATECARRYSADIVVFGYKNVRERSKRTHAWRVGRQMGAREFAERCLLDPRVQGFACNKLYSHKLVARERFPEGVRVCEDLLFNLEIAKETIDLAVICIPGAPYNYDLAGESLTRSANAYSAMRGVLLGLAEDGAIAAAAHGSMYSQAVKALSGMTRGGWLHA